MQLLLSAVHSFPTHVFARAGGGGSGKGAAVVYGGIALVGFAPTYFSSDWCTRNFNKFVGAIVGGLVAIAVAIGFGSFMLLFAPFEYAVIVCGAIAGIIVGCLNLIGKAKQAAARLKKRIEVAASADPVWQEDKLQARIEQTFYEYQKDWSNFDLAHIKTYTTPRYFEHISLMLAAMKTMGRQNVIEAPQLREKYVTTITDSADNDNDSFVAAIWGEAKDKLVETSTQHVLYTDPSSFSELWKFKRHGDTWLLDRIEQTTADFSMENVPLRKFAEHNGMHYSLDWGWLLLPKRGELFRNAGFIYSDVNNHVIGNWHGIIVQLYTYVPNKNEGDNYLIAQITLPKSYGGILIKRKRRIFNNGPRGYLRLEYEWPDFNDRFAVFATDVDKVTSFELLNPKFMAYLYDQNLKVEIEVVDNVVYLYSKVSANEQRYKEMLEILRQAFHELKM